MHLHKPPTAPVRARRLHVLRVIALVGCLAATGLARPVPPTSTAPAASEVIEFAVPPDFTPGPLEGVAGGKGLASPWEVQNKARGGYTVSTQPEMAYRGLLLPPGVISGGDAYQSAGRHLDLSALPGLSRTADHNGGEVTFLGKSATTVYLAVLLQKSEDSDQALFVCLHGAGVPWLTDEQVVSVGFFGLPSQHDGRRVWSLLTRQEGQKPVVQPTTAPVEPGKPALLVLAIHFPPEPPSASTTTPVPAARIELFVNPAVLGAGVPARPDVSTTLPADALRVHTVAIYLGDAPLQGSLAALRIGPSFASVTPTADRPAADRPAPATEP